jgi:rfaE bifunctional protein kinase chain/domain
MPQSTSLRAPGATEYQQQDAIGQILAAIEAKASDAKRLVFVSGNFNVVHPGHLRLLNFAAECGDFLVVGVQGDHFPAVHVPQKLRLEGVSSISVVGFAFPLDVRPEEFIDRLRPAVVVKGKEHELRANAEQPVVESYGGKLLFSSGEVRFSSIDLLQRELRETNYTSIEKPIEFPRRHGFSFLDLAEVVRRFVGLRVLVVGDLIVDEYVNCEPLGMSREDPTLVVSPIRYDRFVGGAGIVAAHAKGLGASVRYFCVTGSDDAARFTAEQLKGLGVEADMLVDENRPTTLKQRFRAAGKTLLRVSHLRQHDIPSALCETMFAKIRRVLGETDLVIFSDFSYGCLPQSLVDRVALECKRREILAVADSQASSQIGDVSRFKGMMLLTPTEHEARLSVRDFSSGLAVLADKLMRVSEAKQVVITLGAEGLLIQAPLDKGLELTTDRLPAFNSAPKDVSGAGDSFLTCASMALACGADIWQSAYLGSIAAACQVSRVGNIPLTAEELKMELSL